MNGPSLMNGPGEMGPVGACLSWNGILIGEILFGNLAMWLAYMIVPIGVFMITRRSSPRPSQPSRFYLPNKPYIRLLLAGFITCCGISRLLGAAGMFYPDHWIMAHWQTLTGVVSLVTCYVVVREMGAERPGPGPGPDNLRLEPV